VPWEFETDPALAARLEWARALVRDEVWSLECVAEEMDEATFHGHLRELQARVREQGLWAAQLPAEIGGAGWGQVALALLNEVIGSSIWWGPIVFGSQAPDSGNAELLAMFANDEQRRRWLEPLVAGEIRSAFSMTEAGTAGSDPTLLATEARRDGDGWVISGEKWFTTNGMVADVLIVMAVTDPAAEPHRRASIFLVPAAAPGVERVRNIASLEQAVPFGYGHAEIRYHDVRVGPEALLGQPGAGFSMAQARLGPGRIQHCMRWLGQSQRAFDILCERAVSRHAFGGALALRQTVGNWIADSAAEMHAARLMTLHAAWTIERRGARAARKEISMVKFWGSRVMLDVIDRAIQVCGSLGYSSDLPLEAMFRFARAARLYDGVDEVHRDTVAKLVLRGYEPVAGPFPSDHLPTRRAVARVRYGLPPAGEAPPP
jgi:acyl-CoA dehydrogenase